MLRRYTWEKVKEQLQHYRRRMYQVLGGRPSGNRGSLRHPRILSLLELLFESLEVVELRIARLPIGRGARPI